MRMIHGRSVLSKPGVNSPEEPSFPRPARFPHHDNINTVIFTPAEYQVDLLDAAKQNNIVICMASPAGKTFVTIMFIKELAHKIRGPYNTGRSRSVVLTNNVATIKRYTQLLRDHTDLSVGEVTNESQAVTEEEWESTFQNQVIVCTTDIFALSLTQKRIDLAKINLVVVDECHLALQPHPARDILNLLKARRQVNGSTEVRPRLLGLSASVLTTHCELRTLERRIRKLESVTGCKAEASGTITSLCRAWSGGTQATEAVVECHEYRGGQVDLEIRQVVSAAIEFLADHRYSPEDIYDMFEEELPTIPDPTVDPLAFLEDLVIVLNSLGVWCAERAAWLFLKELKKFKDKTPYERHYLLLSVVFTVMEKVRAICDYYFRDMEEVDRVSAFSTSNVLRLLEILKFYGSGDENDVIQNVTEAPSADSEVPAPTPVPIDVLSSVKDLIEETNINCNEMLPNLSDSGINKHCLINGNCNNITDNNPGIQDHQQFEVKDVEKDAHTNDPFTAEKQSTKISDKHFDPANVNGESERENVTPNTNYIENCNGLPKQNYTNKTLDFRRFRRKGPDRGSTSNDRSRPTMQHFDPNDTDSLWGVVFVEHRYTACILNMLLKEMSKRHGRLRFLSPNFIMGHRTTLSDGSPADPVEAQLEHRKQEEILRRFRMHEGNLLVATGAVDDSVDLPRCNLVVRFDPPKDFKTYAQSKGRARAVNAHFFMFATQKQAPQFLDRLGEFKVIEEILLSRCTSKETPTINEVDLTEVDHLIGPFYPDPSNTQIAARLSNSISLLNRYCAKLPSDTFTRLVPRCHVQKLPDDGSQNILYQATIRLPINSPLKKLAIGPPVAGVALAKMAGAQTACKMLYEIGELDKNLSPVGKTGVKFEEELVGPWEEETVPEGAPRPGTTKRRQYYNKKTADAFNKCQPKPNHPTFIYAINMKLTCPIPDEQNIRGRKIYAPEDTSQGFGIATSKEIPNVCGFPVFTRSGEVTIHLDRLAEVLLTDSQLDQISAFHKYTFSNVLRLEKYPMRYDPDVAENSLFIVPLNKDESDKLNLDWKFLAIIHADKDGGPSPLSVEDRKNFRFEARRYHDAVVTPWYRNLDQPQYFYVAEICYHLHPKSDFPDDEFETFEKYYLKKYGIQIQNLNQPLLDVDHTSARLNLLTPRYVNRKGVALPTGSEETKRAKRENLQQKQILVPELCAIHPFPASLWRKAVCLPCVLYRANCLLLAEHLRVRVALDIGLGIVNLGPNHKWPVLNFGWSLADVFRTQGAAQLPAASVKIDKQEKDEITPSERVPSSLMTDACENVIQMVTQSVRAQKLSKAEKSGGFTIDTWSNDMAFDENDENIDHYEDNSHLPSNLMLLNDGGIFGEDAELAAIEEANKHMPTSPSDLVVDWSQDGDSHTPSVMPISLVSPGCDTSQQPIRYGSPSNFEMSGWDLDNDLDFNVSDVPGFGFLSASGGGFINVENLSRDLKDLDGVSYQDFESGGEDDDEDDADYGKWNDGNGDSDTNLKEEQDREKDNDVEEFKWELSDDDDRLSSPSEEDMAQRVQEMKKNIRFIAADEALILHTRSKKSDSAIAAKNESLKCSNDDSLPTTCITIATVLEASANAPISSGTTSVPAFQETLPLDPSESVTGGKEVFSFDWQPNLSDHPGPSPSILLQSLTMSNANDGINLERLETIGDSFLKHAITTYLFCTYPGVHEGKLSYLRSKQVSNLKLYRLGRHKGLGECMVATKFEPNDNWLPPGFVVPKELEQALIESGIPASYWNIANLPRLNEWNAFDAEEIRKVLASHMIVHSEIPDENIPHVTTLIQMQSTPQDINADPAEMTCFIPYNLMTQHSIPDKSIADCVEALIGAYLTSCGPRGALLFMSWLGIRVLPQDNNPGSGTTGGATGFGWLVPPPPPSLDHIPDRDRQLEFLLDGYDAFETKIGYQFRDRSYLLQAFTHASYHYNHLTDCYQRLEFLGDAVLDYLITRHLFEDERQHSPGTLTDLRSALVNNTIFASLAVKFEFHKYFKALCPGLSVVIDRFVKMQQENNHHLNEEYYFIEEDECEDVEDIEVPKALGDVFESVAGAIYLDSNMSLDTVWRVYCAMMKSEIEQFSTNVPKSPIRELLEMEPETAKFGKPERTLDGKVRVTVEVFGKGRFSALGRNYRIAKCTAAKHALKALHRMQGTTSQV